MKTINKILVIGLVAIVIFVFMSLPIIPQTVEYQKPVYKTVEHSEPKYETLYTYYLEGGHTIKNVYGVSKEYSGTDFWGNSEYTVTVYYYNGLSKESKMYYEKDTFYKTDTYEAIVGYDTWTETVMDRYVKKERTEYKSVFEIIL